MSITINKTIKLSTLTLGLAFVLASCTSANATSSNASNNNNTKSTQSKSTAEEQKAAAVNSKVKSNSKTHSVMRMDSKASSTAVKRGQVGTLEQKK